MELLNHIGLSVAWALSRLLEPAMGPLERFDLFLRQQLMQLHVPYEWQGTVITAGWVIVLFLLFRALRGFLRVVLVLFVALLMAKFYGAMPPA